MSFSDYVENKLLDHVLKVSSYSVPANIYIALSLADPLDDGSGLAEPAGGDYARVLCNDWNPASGRRTRNTNQVTFATATAAWGEVTHFAIMDAIADGNMLASGMLYQSRIVTTGKTVLFEPNELMIYWEKGGLSNYLANALINHVFKVSSYSVPANIYIALATDTINDASDGDSIEEPSDASYERVLCNDWDAAVDGVSQNTDPIEYDTVINSWGEVSDVALMDADSGGNILFYGKLIEAIRALDGVTVSFDAGELSISMD